MEENEPNPVGKALWEFLEICQEIDQDRIRKWLTPIVDITKKSPKTSSKRMKWAKKSQFVPITSWL